MEMCDCITMILCCMFPAGSALAVHSEIPVTPVHTCSDFYVDGQLKFLNYGI